MFAASQKPPRRSRAAWLSSAAIHVAAAILVIQFRAAILAPPTHRTDATLIFVPGPTPEPRRISLPKQKFRTFRAPVMTQPFIQPALIEPPVIQPPPTPSTRPFPAIPLAPAPLRIRTGVLDAPTPIAAPQAHPSPSVQAAGFDASSPAQGGSDQSKHVSVMSDFGSVARASGPPRSGPVVAGGFGSASMGTADAVRPQRQTGAAFDATIIAKAPNAHPAVPQAEDCTPVEITYQPRPAYTDEARRLQIEGEVLIEAVFTASGKVQIVRIARGLGHGLNESAIAAVSSIRFRPARKHGQPVDSTATVRMSFELAY